jgi:hypothetical protein
LQSIRPRNGKIEVEEKPPCAERWDSKNNRANPPGKEWSSAKNTLDRKKAGYEPFYFPVSGKYLLQFLMVTAVNDDSERA